jgi:hypothetical protein
VQFNGAEMSFTFDGFSGNWWSFGFCSSGTLDKWRTGKPAKE